MMKCTYNIEDTPSINVTYRDGHLHTHTHTTCYSNKDNINKDKDINTIIGQEDTQSLPHAPLPTSN